MQQSPNEDAQATHQGMTGGNPMRTQGQEKLSRIAQYVAMLLDSAYAHRDEQAIRDYAAALRLVNDCFGQA
jgi:hypothetical protein